MIIKCGQSERNTLATTLALAHGWRMIWFSQSSRITDNAYSLPSVTKDGWRYQDAGNKSPPTPGNHFHHKRWQDFKQNKLIVQRPIDSSCVGVCPFLQFPKFRERSAFWNNYFPDVHYFPFFAMFHVENKISDRQAWCMGGWSFRPMCVYTQCNTVDINKH